MLRDGVSLKLSVFTIGRASASDCRMVIEELSKQTCRDELEVLVVTPDRRGIEEDLIRPFGAWQWIDVPDVRACGEAMHAAVRAARAPFVTYAEEHSYFHEDWAERLIAAHHRGYDAVGFAMENANPEMLTSWAHLYAQFGPVVAPVESQESDFLAGHHTSYRRSLLLGYGRDATAMLEDESALFLDLHRKGVAMFIAGDAVSRHVNISSCRALMQLEFNGMRSFASTRAATARWTWWKRGLYACAAPLIPIVRLRRILPHIRRTGRQKDLMPRILGPLSVCLLAGACGEGLGYLLGSGRSAARKIPVELDRESYLSTNDPWTKPRQTTPVTVD